MVFLGTGTSQGVPVIGCNCQVCQSNDPRDKRLRTSVLIRWGQNQVCVDCGPDFRQQMLREKIKFLNAIVFTHEHNDHVVGLDDIRPFNYMSGGNMRIFSTQQVLTSIKKRFDYVFAAEKYPGAPSVDTIIIDKHQSFAIDGKRIIPIEVMHGQLPVLGYRISNLSYLTDVKYITDEEMEKLEGTEVLVVSALHHKPHRTHQNVDEAIALINRIKPKRAYLTHASHRMGKYADVASTLPDHVQLAYDGLKICSS